MVQFGVKKTRTKEQKNKRKQEQTNIRNFWEKSCAERQGIVEVFLVHKFLYYVVKSLFQ
jgi:hypothetical protein